jgi:hypothetical protein
VSGFFSGSFDSTWPHATLLTMAIVASFAVGIGIVLENPKWSLANVLVIGGVALEAVCTLLLFGFDEGISNAQQSKIERQNTEIIALRKNSIPRSIDVSAFAERLAGAPPSDLEIRYVRSCIDCESLSFWLSEALKKAHWPVDAPIAIDPQNGDWVRVVQSLHAQSSGITVVISSPDRITADPKSSLGALSGALGQALGFNFLGYDANTRGGVDVTLPPELIRIVIAPRG